MDILNNDIRYVKGFGEKRSQTLHKLGIHTLKDLVCYYPRDYEDRTQILNIGQLQHGVSACFKALVTSAPSRNSYRKTIRAKASDGADSIDLVFFNRTSVVHTLEEGETYIFFGTPEVVGRSRKIVNPLFEKEGTNIISGRLLPIYRLTAGLTHNNMRKMMQMGLAAVQNDLTDPLPSELRVARQLCHRRFAVENIHFPKDFTALRQAKYRLVYEELFIFSVGLSMFRKRRTSLAGPVFSFTDTSEILNAFAFPLTNAQKRVISESVSDMASGRSMNRLIQGDVGSGKTAVAMVCAYIAIKNGYQTAFMVPTEILANQHYESVRAVFEPLNIRTGLLTGSMTASQKRKIKEQLALGEINLVVGTHALFSKDIEYFELGLVITDEQHRFGVFQRAALMQKGKNPHILVMSATPIPRTLALIIHKDLDISIIDELPPGRKTVKTYAVTEKLRERIYLFMRKLIDEGRQVFIVCPAVEDDEENDLESVEKYAETLKNEIFPDLRIALIHGKLKDKDEVMENFSKGGADILVATTVIEVGVDVPNAALMVVENADRFGLSQLHQLRGRVGRGQHESFCVLISGNSNEITNKRLSVMCRTSDGFQISEADLQIRGPGDIFGSRQHGLPSLNLASLSYDVVTLKQAQEDSEILLKKDPALRSPEHQELKKQIDRLFSDYENSFN